MLAAIISLLAWSNSSTLGYVQIYLYCPINDIIARDEPTTYVGT